MALIYEEPYFNRRHRPAPDVVATIRRRFVADDLISPYAQSNGSPFGIEAPINRRRKADPAGSSQGGPGGPVPDVVGLQAG